MLQSTWNTGRSYGPTGQPMCAVLVGDRAFFADAARGIEGSLAVMPEWTETEGELRRAVMWAYDGGNYANEPIGTVARLLTARHLTCRHCGRVYDDLKPAEGERMDAGGPCLSDDCPAHDADIEENLE